MSNPIAGHTKNISKFILHDGGEIGYVPIGTDTPTNFPFWRAGPVFGTNLPKMIPMAMAKSIHSARNRSSNPSPLNADAFDNRRLSSKSSCAADSRS
jgi:hypothetical protein